MIPISRELIQPIIKSNIEYVDSIEEFEKIELEPNQAILRFNNNIQCFYTRERNRYGEYSKTKIFFYEDFSQKAQRLEREEFFHKCKDVGYDDVKAEVACKFFIDNMKPQDVWLWLLENKIKDWSWDYVTSLHCTMKKKLSIKIIKT